MNNEQTLLDLGFVPYSKWDFKETGTKHYRLEKDGKVFRAYVQLYNPPTYVVIGEVTNLEKGLVRRWVDCVSECSVERFIITHTRKPLTA